MNRTVLITGVAGFIGSHVSEALTARGDTVIGIDNFDDYYDPHRKRQNLKELSPSARESLKLVEIDIRDRTGMLSIFEQYEFDVVVHLAAMAGVRRSVEEPELYIDVNVLGTLSLLEASRHGPTDPLFIFASTSSVYGESEEGPFRETDPCDRPLVPYAASKRAGEMLGHTYHRQFGLDFTALRFFTVFGPRNRPDMMAYKVVDGVFRGTEVPLYGNGDLSRDWTFISDIVDGVVSASERRLGYEIVNLGRGEPVKVQEFVATVEALCDKKARLIEAPRPVGDVSRTWADVSRARDLLGYVPSVGLEEGVGSLISWYRSKMG